MGRLLGLAQLRSRWGGRYLVVGLRRRDHYRCARGTRRRSPRIRTLTGDLGGERPRVGGGRKLDSVAAVLSREHLLPSIWACALCRAARTLVSDERNPAS